MRWSSALTFIANSERPDLNGIGTAIETQPELKLLIRECVAILGHAREHFPNGSFAGRRVARDPLKLCVRKIAIELVGRKLRKQHLTHRIDVGRHTRAQVDRKKGKMLGRKPRDVDYIVIIEHAERARTRRDRPLPPS